MAENKHTIAQGYKVAKRRADEKKDTILKWLYQYNVSTQRLMAALLNVDERGQYQFFTRLRKSKFVDTTQHEALGREQLYRLTNDGMAEAARIHGYALSRPAHISHQVLMHDLTVQAAVIRRLEIPVGEAGEIARLIDYVSERNFISEGKDGASAHGKKPDALLIYPNYKIALELELSHKNNSRIYYNFLNHLKNIRDEHYNAVAYVFSSQKLRDLYEQKFLQPEWPVYGVGRMNRLVRSPTNFTLKPEHRRFFTFTVEQGYFV